MKVTYKGKVCIEISDDVFKRLFRFYPEEKLLERQVLAEALQSGYITFSDLKSEAEKAFIPWQMFLLMPEKLTRQIQNIEKNRADKIRSTHVSRRSGGSGDTPYRLIDRYIRAQNFLTSTGYYTANTYNGSLVGFSATGAARKIVEYFELERGVMTTGTKGEVLQYFVQRLEAKNVNVGIGAMDARLVPSSENYRKLFKNISGFCLRDANVPFIYVNASMATEEEPLGRQIYTLIYLLVLIGLDEFTLARNISPRSVATIRGGNARFAHAVTSEILMPADFFEDYRGTVITADQVISWSNKFKVTPSAVLMRLLRLSIIDGNVRDSLAFDPYVKKSGGGGTSPISTAVKKFNGGLVTDGVSRAYTSKAITPINAQYILFGRVGRHIWRDYRALTGLI